MVVRELEQASKMHCKNFVVFALLMYNDRNKKYCRKIIPCVRS